MDKRVTQIFADLSQMEDWGPSAPTPGPGQTESQPLGTHKPTKGVKQRAEQNLSKNILRDHRRNNRPGEILAVHSPAIHRGCPWDTLTDLFTCDLAGPVSLAVHKEDPRGVIAVRSFSKDKADKWPQVFGKTKHPNVISARDICKDHGTTYCIVDDLPLTLEHVVACDIFPFEQRIPHGLAEERVTFSDATALHSKIRARFTRRLLASFPQVLENNNHFH